MLSTPFADPRIGNERQKRLLQRLLGGGGMAPGPGAGFGGNPVARFLGRMQGPQYTRPMPNYGQSLMQALGPGGVGVPGVREHSNNPGEPIPGMPTLPRPDAPVGRPILPPGIGDIGGTPGGTLSIPTGTPRQQPGGGIAPPYQENHIPGQSNLPPGGVPGQSLGGSDAFLPHSGYIPLPQWGMYLDPTTGSIYVPSTGTGIQ